MSDGSRAWAIGGPPLSKLFDSELTGQYFHGVPVAAGSELFVVAEKDNQISLHALDARTGERSWSQLLAFSDSSIAADFRRRNWTAQVTVSNGILICPTTVGWLVAVDPLTQTVLWARRYTKPTSGRDRRTGRRGYSLSARPLVNQWPVSAPVVAGNSVVYTPPEANTLVCLDVTTGETKWQRAKGSMRYVAGAIQTVVESANSRIVEDRVIVVSVDRIDAIRLDDQKIMWSRSLRNEGAPAGRGVLTTSHLHQPMSSGRVISLDLKTGAISARTGTRRTELMLANLVMYSGGMLLQSATDLEAFELRPQTGQRRNDRRFSRRENPSGSDVAGRWPGE